MEELRQAIKDYRDYWGLPIHYQDEIEEATTYKELGEILDRYHNFIDDMANDAQCMLSRWRRDIGLDKMIDEEESNGI